MNTRKIIFHKFKVEIIEESKGYIYYYGDILYITYNKPYCKIFCLGRGKSHMLHYSLNILLKILPPVFFRCERSVIINLARMKKYDFTSMKITMEDDHILPLANRKKNDFIKLKTSITNLTAPFQDCFSCDSIETCCESYSANLKNEEKIVLE
jgi:DNA-binding LytR/AlgR family response regulator